MTDADRVEYRLLSDMRDLAVLAQLERDVWQSSWFDVTPSALLIAFIHNGGQVIGAYLGERLVAMLLAFVSWRGNDVLLWSHKAGVHADFQGRGIGQGIKLAQRRFALERGYTRINWTYDPLLRGNANFNFNLLGVTAQTYYVNHYGEMQDSINAGLPSDRLEVQWDLNDERVIAIASGEEARYASEDAPFLLEADGQGAPLVNPKLLAEQPARCRVEIPRNVDEMRRLQPERALAWRLALREALHPTFAAGYSARDFAHQDGRCWYVLTRG